MRDYKAPTAPKVKKNKKRREREPRDWKAFFQKLLHGLVATVSALLIIAGGTIAARMLVASDYFQVESVRVENAERVSVEEVIGLSDIAIGSSIFDLNLEMIGKRIEENPWVRTARIERIFPRDVVIRLEERSPRAIINLGYLYYLDEAGDVFKMLNAGDRLDHPVITGIDRQDFLDQPELTRNRLRLALALIDELAERRRFSLDAVSELHLCREEGISLYTYLDGVPILLGEGAYAEKLNRLEYIYKELEPRLPALKYIDLKVPDRVIVKLDNRPLRTKS